MEGVRNRIDSKGLSPMEYTRKKCMLSSRFHPVKVESVGNGGARDV